MVAHRHSTTITVEEYRALEESSGVKHEYVHGEVYAMSGGTIAHDIITNNTRTAILNHMGDGPCLVLGPDVRLRVSESIYYYPDAMVTCDETLDDEAIEVTAPRLIVEVLSDSTEAADRGGKFANYQSIASFEEYLLIDSRSQAVERYHRTAPDLWTYRRYAPDETVTLETIGLTCPVAAFYRRTQL